MSYPPRNEQLVRARKERGLSQEDLAAKIGASPQSIGRWERGETLPTPQLLRRLCEFLGKTPEELDLFPLVKEESSEAPSAHLTPLTESSPIVPETAIEAQQAVATSLTPKEMVIQPALFSSAPSLHHHHPRRRRNRLFVLGSVVAIAILILTLFLRNQHGPVRSSLSTGQNQSALFNQSCPTTKITYPVTMPLLSMKQMQYLIYIETKSTGNILGSKIVRYDVNTGSKKMLFSIENGIVGRTQLSQDRQWLLFTTEGKGLNTLQMIRIDGCYLQTLYRTPQAEIIEQSLFAPDEKSVVFTQPIGESLEAMYLLDLTSGIRQPILVTRNTFFTVVPFAWADTTHLYVEKSVRGASCPCTSSLYLLDLTRGTNQDDQNLKWIINMSDQVHVMYRFESKQLFISRCEYLSAHDLPPVCSSPSTISVRSVADPTEKVLYRDPLRTITSLLAISIDAIFFEVQNNRFDSSNHTYIFDTNDSGIWRVGLDGTGLRRLLAFDQHRQQFVLTQDGEAYAESICNDDDSCSLLLGPITHALPQTIETVPAGDYSDIMIVGWVTVP